MKQLLTLVVSWLLTSCCVSQIPQPGDNIINSNLDKFEGTWKWISDSSELTIKLKKVNYLSFDNSREDVLIGVHTYVEKGVVIENYLGDFPKLGQGHKGSIFVWGKLGNTAPDDVTGTMNDLLKHKQNYISLKYMNGAIPQLIFHLSNLSAPLIPKKVAGLTVTPSVTFTIPQDLVLSRM